ncbi:MAG: hypothetical protein ACOC1U_07765 [Spirochaetota bacterium]
MQAWIDQAAEPDDSGELGNRVLTELAEMQMVLERHLAETPGDQREIERYYLEFQLPTFTYLRRWYQLSVLTDDDPAPPPPRSMTT